jgi:hypothetical protein
VKKLTLFSLGLVALALPCLSSACHVTDTWGNADCDGWNLCTTVYFSSNVDEGSLEYTITIIDLDNNVVTSFGETLTITHSPGEGTFEYCFEGVWDGEYFVTNATVVITSALDGQNPTVFTFDLACTVDSEDSTFGSLKALFR